MGQTKKKKKEKPRKFLRLVSLHKTQNYLSVGFVRMKIRRMASSSSQLSTSFLQPKRLRDLRGKKGNTKDSLARYVC